MHTNNDHCGPHRQPQELIHAYLGPKVVPVRGIDEKWVGVDVAASLYRDGHFGVELALAQIQVDQCSTDPSEFPVLLETLSSKRADEMGGVMPALHTSFEARIQPSVFAFDYFSFLLQEVRECLMNRVIFTSSGVCILSLSMIFCISTSQFF